MIPKENNFAYIDGANLHKGNKSLGWKLNYKRFRVWLAEKYGVKTAYLFLGLIPSYSRLYKHLQEAGFILVLKQKDMLRIVISPSNKCSFLLRQQNIPLSYLNDSRDKLEFIVKEKAPHKDGTL